MRTLAIAITLLIHSFASPALTQDAAKQPQKFQFIRITKPVQWDDGMACTVGEIEVVLEFKANSYVIWNDNGKRYEINRTHAEKITSDVAAAALLVKRQELYAAQRQLTDALAQAMQNRNQIRDAQDQLALLKQLQDLVNGGGVGNLPMIPAGQVGNHWIKKVIERGQTIQLEDGSIWQINPISKVDVILWLPTERISIAESGNAIYPYKLINSDGGSVAEAKLVSR